MTLYIDDYTEWKDNCESQDLRVEVGPEYNPDLDVAFDEYNEIFGEYDFDDGQGWIKIKQEEN